MRFTLLIAGLLLLWQGNAQTPGYLGKRFYVKPEIGAMIAFQRPTASNQGRGEHYGVSNGSLGFNTEPGLQLGYAVSRRHVLAFKVGYIKTGMLLTAQTPALLYENLTDSHDLFYHLTGLEYGISWQSYNPLKGGLAPMGFFTAWQLKVAPMKGKIVDKRTSYGSGDASAGHAPLGIDAAFTHWSLGFEFGKHIILFDQLVLSLSTEINFPPVLLVFDDQKFNSQGDNQQRFRQAAFERMSFHSFFLFKFGAGYLF